MAGTLTIGTLSDGTNSTSSTDAIKGSAKAWVNFNGVSTASIRASYNVSSVTRNAAGDYTVTFTSAMSDANYVVCGSGSLQGSTSTSGGNVLATGRNAAPTTTAVRVETINPGTATPDTLYVSVAIFR